MTTQQTHVKLWEPSRRDADLIKKLESALCAARTCHGEMYHFKSDDLTKQNVSDLKEADSLIENIESALALLKGGA